MMRAEMAPRRIFHSSAGMFLLAMIAACATARAEVSLRIVQPYENSNIAAVRQSFVFGSVTPATATLTINGIPVTPYTNGGFLAMIPFHEGKFKIEAVATDGISTSSATRTVNVAGTIGTFSSTYGKIDVVSPKVKLVVRPGDTIDLSFQAAPGGSASARFRLRGDKIEMQEQPGPVRGIYKGIYIIQPTDHFDGDDIVFTLRRKDGRRLSTRAGSNITVQRRKTPRLVELKEDTVLLTGPESDYGYNLFCLTGTRLEITGEYGDYLRAAVGSTNQSWFRKSAAIDLPKGALPAKSVTRNLKIGVVGDSTIVEIPLQYRHAFRIEQSVEPHRLQVTLFGVTADSDRMRYKTDNTVVKEISWYQSDPTTAVFDIQTTQDEAWGYDARYEGTTFVLEIRHRPNLKGNSLKGLKVAVDAGHSRQSFGTIGPWGNTEASVNLLLANVLKKELENRGAEVVMTQDGTREISLSERSAMAWHEKANIFISLHCDACADGQDPRQIQGFSVHYYQPQSHAFASALHDVYAQKSGIRDEGLWRSNLAVCRATQMPAVLFEQAFLVLPEYEELLLTPKHQKMAAESIIAAIEDVFDQHPK
jgi:N-acetylmuramoyl-L-alanine amidase